MFEYHNAGDDDGCSPNEAEVVGWRIAPHHKEGCQEEAQHLDQGTENKLFVCGEWIVWDSICVTEFLPEKRQTVEINIPYRQYFQREVNAMLWTNYYLLTEGITGSNKIP